RSRGAEIGLRTSTFRGLRSTVSAWMLDLDSELLFVGDGGTTEPAAGSRRHGVTFSNFYRPVTELAIDADLSLARARFVDVPAGEASIPGALERVVAGGIAWTPAQRGLFGALRVRSFGAYPLVEDNSVRARPSTLVNADVGLQLHTGTRLRLSILNVLDARADDIQYFYRSRLPGEPPTGFDDVHFHPAEPRQLRASIEWRF
ncbi:MAG TPA: hypothetical protein VH559_05505, partial [Gemmatimonadaceae bacterium]